MGMYTELIFGCSLKSNTPSAVIALLQAMVKGGGEIDKIILLPDHDFFKCERWRWLFTGGSYYFGVNEALGKIWQDNIDKEWKISTRSNIKNYDGEIEKFLDWIKPYIESGSGEQEMYAITTYEDSTPIIYYLEDEKII
jgi:hypothetical protein